MNNIKEVKIIGLAAPKQSGKTSIADDLVCKLQPFCPSYLRRPSPVRASFASPLRTVLEKVFGIGYELMSSEEGKNTLTSYNGSQFASFIDTAKLPNGDGPMSVRTLMQTVGTDVFRRINPNIWIECMQRKIEEYTYPVSVAVIDDVRFRNETEWILSKGGKVLFIDRGDYRAEHSSEDFGFIEDADLSSKIIRYPYKKCMPDKQALKAWVNGAIELLI